MDFMTIGSINSYVKNMSMESKWQSRKNTNNYAADGAKTISDWMEQQKKKTEEQTSVFDHLKNNNSDSKLNSIRTKLTNGSKLTPAEKDYLRKKDAQTYKKVQEIEAEEKDFENKLRRCKTKDEVRRLKLNYVSASLAAVNSVKDSPYISDADKRAFMEGQQMKMAAIDRVQTEFVRSGEFDKLPTDVERAEAAKEMAEAMNPSVEDKDENNSENVSEENTEENSQVKAEENAALNNSEKTAESSVHEDKGEAAKVKVISHNKRTVKVKTHETKKSDGAHKIAEKAKTEQSAAVKKVRRRRIKVSRPASYTAGGVGVSSPVSTSAAQSADVGNSFDATA